MKTTYDSEYVSIIKGHECVTLDHNEVKELLKGLINNSNIYGGI